ncbi:MAG: DUF3365 domain-containing protein [Nitrospira sp.]|nr:DUF3365 domain-containing protein [Nitrospira sp.]
MPWRKTLTTGLGGMLCLLMGWGTGLAGKESAMVPRRPSWTTFMPCWPPTDFLHRSCCGTNATAWGDRVSERWRSEKTLPLPAQFVQESSRLAALTGVKVQYRLISLHPINKLSSPTNEFEKKALEAIMADPNRPYKGFVTEGGERRFQALYADHAVSPVCVTCHNAHPQSLKRDYKLNDVLGAVLISIPAPS